MMAAEVEEHQEEPQQTLPLLSKKRKQGEEGASCTTQGCVAIFKNAERANKETVCMKVIMLVPTSTHALHGKTHDCVPSAKKVGWKKR